MKRSVLIALILVFAATGACAGGVTKYGKELTLKETTGVAEILANPEKYNGKRVKVEGTVTDVCTMRGCWIKIAGSKTSDAIRFKVDDGVIEFPKDVKGKTAVAEGVVSVTTVSVDEQIKQGEHEAQEGEKKFDPKSVKGPRTTIEINGEGAEIK